MNFLKQFNLLFLALFLFGFNSTSIAQPKSDQLDQLLQKYFEYGKFNGSILVSFEDEILLNSGYGYANMEWEQNNAADTKHRLGSITKQFTAMLILQLAENGDLDLHQPISTYLPDYPKKVGQVVTAHHLLTHSAGIPNYTAIPGFIQSYSMDAFSPVEFLDFFKDLDSPAKTKGGYFLILLKTSSSSFLS